MCNGCNGWLLAGKEWPSDAQLLMRDLIPTNGLTVMVNYSTNENNYSLPTREVAEAAVAQLPSTLLSQEVSILKFMLTTHSDIPLIQAYQTFH